MYNLVSAKRDIGFVALGIGFIFLVSLIFQFLILIIAMAIAPNLLSSALFLQFASAVSMYAIAMPLSLLFFLRCRTIMHPEKRTLSGKTLLQFFCVCMAGSYIGSIVGNYINLLFSSFLGREAVNPVDEMTSVLNWWQILLFVVILPPIFEELFFRKLVIDRLLPYGELPAILISGLAFGMVHGNFNQFFYAAAIGVIFGFIYLRSGRIRYSILLHMMINFIGGFYISEALRMTEGAYQGGIFAFIPSELIGVLMTYLYFALLVTSAVVTIVTVCKRANRSNLVFWKPYIAPTKNDWVAILLGNPMVWFFYAVTVLMFFL